MNITLLLCLVTVPYAECGPATAYQIVPVESTLTRQECVANAPYLEIDPALRKKVGPGRYYRIMCGNYQDPKA